MANKASLVGHVIQILKYPVVFLPSNPFTTSPSKFRKTRRKLQILTSLTIHFSSKSDQYSNIYCQLKIKFPDRNFCTFEFQWNWQISVHKWNIVSGQFLLFWPYFTSSRRIFERWQQEFQQFYLKSLLKKGDFDEKLHKCVNDAWYVQTKIWSESGGNEKMLMRGQSPLSNNFNFHP